MRVEKKMGLWQLKMVDRFGIRGVPMLSPSPHLMEPAAILKRGDCIGFRRTISKASSRRHEAIESRLRS